MWRQGICLSDVIFLFCLIFKGVSQNVDYALNQELGKERGKKATQNLWLAGGKLMSLWFGQYMPEPYHEYFRFNFPKEQKIHL